MRVLHAICGLDARSGGPQAAMAGLAVAQRRVGGGTDVAVVATWAPGTDLGIADGLRAEGVEVQTVGPCRTTLDLSGTTRAGVREAVARADVVHIHGLWEDVQHAAALAARRAGKPYVVTPHGMLTSWSLAQKRLKKLVYLAWRLRRDLRLASAIHFTSAAERDASTGVKLETPTIVEPLGVDLSEFDPLPPSGAMRSIRPDLPDRPYVVFLGRIFPGKGLELLIPAFAAASAKLDDAILIVVGPDPSGYQREMEELAVRSGCRERVFFTGMLRGGDRVAALRDARLFALPSAHENFGVAIVEALAASCPVLISDGVAIRHEIAAAGVGEVVPQNVAAWADALSRWWNDPALRAQAAARARPFVWKNYDWSHIAGRWTEHYRKLVRGEGAPSHEVRPVSPAESAR